MHRLNPATLLILLAVFLTPLPAAADLVFRFGFGGDDRYRRHPHDPFGYPHRGLGPPGWSMPGWSIPGWSIPGWTGPGYGHGFGPSPAYRARNGLWCRDYGGHPVFPGRAFRTACLLPDGRWHRVR